MGRTRLLLVALLGVLATPASAFAGTCLDATTGVATDVQSGSAHDHRLDRSARPAGLLPLRPRADDRLRLVDADAGAHGDDTDDGQREAGRAHPGHDLPLPPRRDHRVRERGGARRDVHHAARARSAAARGRAARLHVVGVGERRGRHHGIRWQRGSRPVEQPRQRLRPRALPRRRARRVHEHEEWQRRPVRRQPGRQRADPAHAIALLGLESRLVARWQEHRVRVRRARRSRACS